MRGIYRRRLAALALGQGTGRDESATAVDEAALERGGHAVEVREERMLQARERGVEGEYDMRPAEGEGGGARGEGCARSEGRGDVQ